MRSAQNPERVVSPRDQARSPHLAQPRRRPRHRRGDLGDVVERAARVRDGDRTDRHRVGQRDPHDGHSARGLAAHRDDRGGKGFSRRWTTWRTGGRTVRGDPHDGRAADVPRGASALLRDDHRCDVGRLAPRRECGSRHDTRPPVVHELARRPRAREPGQGRGRRRDAPRDHLRRRVRGGARAHRAGSAGGGDRDLPGGSRTRCS